MDKENLPWRSFAYQEAINAKWGNNTPAYYVIAASTVTLVTMIWVKETAFEPLQ